MCFAHVPVHACCCLGMYFRCGNCSLWSLFLYFAGVELGSRVASVQIALVKQERIACSQSQLCRNVVVTCCGGYYPHLIVFSVEAPCRTTEVIAAYSTSKSKGLKRQPPGRAWSFECVTSAVQNNILPRAKQMCRNAKISKYHWNMQYDLDRNIQTLTS